MARKRIKVNNDSMSCTFILISDVYDLMIAYTEKNNITDKSKWISDLIKIELDKNIE